MLVCKFDQETPRFGIHLKSIALTTSVNFSLFFVFHTVGCYYIIWKYLSYVAHDLKSTALTAEGKICIVYYFLCFIWMSAIILLQAWQRRKSRTPPFVERCAILKLKIGKKKISTSRSVVRTLSNI